MNVLSEAEQHEFALCYILEKDSTLRVLSNDEYILDVTSELETKNENFTFILTRTVWIHPLREDNKLYIDVLFFQLVPNYMTGLLTTLPKGLNGPLPAKILDDAAVLAALLYTASEAPLSDLTEKTVTSLIPVTVFERSRLSTTNWLSRIKHKISVLPSTYDAQKARLEFLSTLLFKINVLVFFQNLSKSGPYMDHHSISLPNASYQKSPSIDLFWLLRKTD